MIRPEHLWLIIDPIDMRSGIDTLSLVVQSLPGHRPCDGSAYAFRNRRGTRLKLLIWDGTGVWLCQRRLHQGHFLWPTADTPTATLTTRQWNWLIFELNAAQPNAMAEEALRRIAALYEIEQRGRAMSIADRAALRQGEAQPLLQAMHAWLLSTRTRVANGGGTAKAMDYSLRRWAALSRYATDGVLPIDNNPVENTIHTLRPIAIGKKNWLFAGSERAGKRAAAIQSLLGTACLNGLDPAQWLRETLERLPTCMNSQIDSLLPFLPFLPFRPEPLPHTVS